MKSLRIIIGLLLFTPFFAQALECGTGKITRVHIGGWNSDDLIIRLDNSVSTPSDPSVMFSTNYVRFRRNTYPNRIDAFISIAIAANLAGVNVRAVTHTGDCGDASELALGY